jgi:hypothetical protein
VKSAAISARFSSRLEVARTAVEVATSSLRGSDMAG